MAQATDFAAVRAALARMGSVPLDLLEAAYREHVGGDLALEQIEAFYKTLRRLAQRCEDSEFEAYVTRGEAPALVPLSPRELEVLQGAGRAIRTGDTRVATFVAALTAELKTQP